MSGGNEGGGNSIPGFSPEDMARMVRDLIIYSFKRFLSLVMQ